jgi:Leucine Rich repeat
LKGLKQLQRLNLSGTKVTDAGLRHLRGLTTLRTLELIDTGITDTGLKNLKGLTNLHRLYLNQTKVTAAGVKDLQKILPKVKITRWSGYKGWAFGDLPILADALEDAGCTSRELLAHLRGPGPHVLGCWALDLVLNKKWAPGQLGPRWEEVGFAMRALLSKPALALFVGLFLALLALAILAEGGWVQLALAGEIVLVLAL